MYLGKKELLMVLEIIEEVLNRYSWKELEKLRDKIIERVGK